MVSGFNSPFNQSNDHQLHAPKSFWEGVKRRQDNSKWLMVTGCHQFGIFPLILGLSSSQLTKSIIFSEGFLAHQPAKDSLSVDLELKGSFKSPETTMEAAALAASPGGRRRSMPDLSGWAHWFSMGTTSGSFLRAIFPWDFSMFRWIQIWGHWDVGTIQQQMQPLGAMQWVSGCGVYISKDKHLARIPIYLLKMGEW